MKIVKENLKVILAIMITATICITGTVYATTRFNANEIGYSTTTVADALDSMYQTMFSNNYSETEKQVGTWIDGKPLYQKTYIDTLSSSSATQSISIGESYSVVNIYAVIFNDGVRILNGHFDGSNRFNAYIENSAIKLIRNNSSSWANKTVYVTLQYTKTTDPVPQN